MWIETMEGPQGARLALPQPSGALPVPLAGLPVDLLRGLGWEEFVGAISGLPGGKCWWVPGRLWDVNLSLPWAQALSVPLLRPQRDTGI